MINLPELQSGEIYDQSSDSIIKISDGHIQVKYSNSTTEKWPIPVNINPNDKKFQHIPLKFVQGQNLNISINPSGSTVICKADTIQEVDMNKSFTQGIVYWSLYISQPTLGFSVGIKDIENKKNQTFQFSLKKSVLLTFKVDFNKCVFKCWLNNVESELKPQIGFQKGRKWTPFLRIKTNGSSVMLNSLINDPEESTTPLNPYRTSSQIIQQPFCENLSKQNFEIPLNEQTYRLQKVNQDSLILYSGNNLRLIRRQNSSKFDFKFNHFLDQENIVVAFSEQQYSFVNYFAKKIGKSLIGQALVEQNLKIYYVKKSKQDWKKCFEKTLNLIDRLIKQFQSGFNGQNTQKSYNFSLATLHEIGKIFLTKFQTLRLWLNEDSISNIYSNLDKQMSWGTQTLMFPKLKSAFQISKYHCFNNLPSLSFNSKIKQIKSDGKSFAVCRFQQGNRVCLVNIQSICFKVIDINIGKGFKKQNQINQYKKEAEEIQANNFTQPHIYKILKNCLKYADKIKPPQKLLKQIQVKKKEEIIIKKEKEKIKFPGQLEPDNVLLTSLIQMGFNEKLSKKVLLQSKNASLQAAIDLILTKYQHQNIQTPTFSPTKKLKNDWSCTVCTFINKNTASVCQICNSQAPKQAFIAEQTKIQKQKIQQKFQQKQMHVPEMDINVSSQNIDQNLKNIFVWNTKVNYCPILICAVFQTKIRLRLLGPNPKYYSNFYAKDNGFIDLSTFNNHQLAHLIERKPIQFLNYLSSTSSEIKLNSFGWINIQDFDLEFKQEINDISFQSQSFNKDSQNFLMKILSKNTQYTYQSKILIQNVYEEKRKCLQISTQFKKSQMDKKAEDFSNYLIKNDYSQPNGNKLTENNQIICSFANNNSSPFSVYDGLLKTIKSVQFENQTSKNILPMIALSGPYGFDLHYPKAGLYSSSQKVFNRQNLAANGIVFSHIHNKKVSVKAIVIQKSKKGAIEDCGFVYLSNDIQKVPLIRYSYQFSEDNLKTVINIQDKKQYSHVVVIVNPKQCLQSFALSSVYIYGEAFESDNKILNTNVSADFLVSQKLSIKFDAEEFNQKNFKETCKIQAYIYNLPFDMSQVQDTEDLIQNLLRHNYPLDLKLIIKSKTKHDKPIKINDINLQGWTKISQNSKQASTQKSVISSTDYTSYLQNYLKTGDVQLFDFIQDQNNFQYRKSILALDFQEFLYNKVFSCQYDIKSKNKHQTFLKIFMPFIKTKLDINALFKTVTNSQKITAYGIQLAFYLFRYLQPENDIVFKQFFKILSLIKQKKQSLNLINAKNVWESFYYDKTIFSDYCHNLLEKNKNSSRSSDLITTHFIVFRQKFTRRYIIDMMSTYNLQNLSLKFDRAQERAKLKIKVNSISSKGEQVQVFKYFYDEHIWDQICRTQHEGLNNISINLKGIKSRYLIIDLSFTNLPNAATKKQSENIPQNQIIPQLFGSYIGESDAYLGKYFNFSNQSLTFIKKIDYMNKFSVKIGQKNATCYNSEYRFILQQNNNLQQLQNKSDILNHKDAIVKVLMQNPSKDNLNYLYTKATFILNSLLDSSNLQSYKLQVQQICLLLDVFINHQKGLIAERGINLLRKVMKSNSEVILNLLKCKINSEINFISLFKQFNLFSNVSLSHKLEELTHVDRLKQNKSLLLNLARLTKITENCPSNILQKIVKSSVVLGQFQQILFLFVKFGWILGSQDVLSLLIKNKTNYQNIQLMIKSSKNVQQLCEYALLKLKNDQQDIFQLVCEELSKKNRKVSASNVKSIIYQLLKMIHQNQGQENCQYFVTALNMTNTFGFDHQTAIQIIKNYFSLTQKQVYLSQLFGSKILNDKSFYEVIISECVKIINTNKYTEDELSLISQILIFILKKQSDIQNQSISLQLTKQTQTLIIQAFSNFLKSKLNIGGIQSAKLIGQEVTQNISIAFFLSIFCRDHQIFLKVSPQTLKNFVQWMFYNVRTNLLKSAKTYGGSKFIKIQQTVWKIIEGRSKGNIQEFSTTFMQQYIRMKKQLKQIKNQIIRNLNQQKCYYLISKVIQQLSISNISLVRDLLDKNNLFSQLLQHIIALDSKTLNQAQEIVEKQLVNTFNLKDNKDPAPKDWLAHKNGAKNHVYRIQFAKSTQQVNHLTFESQKQVTLSKIILGFKYDYLPAQKNICLPKQIQVQGGLSLDKLKLIGKMTLIPDDFYMNYSVKIFGYNTSMIKPGQTLALSCNKNQAIKFLRFKIKSPDTVSISDAINTDLSVQANSVSLINFLSVQGYSQQFVSPQVDEVVRSFELLSKPQHKKLIQQLFAQQLVVSNFKKSLLNISFLMKNEKYQKVLHNFLMRICQQNSTIGNQMIDKYLQLQNSQLCSKISAQIVLSNDKEVSHRVVKYFTFINSILHNNFDKISQLLPFLKRFIQIGFIIMNRKKIDSSIQIQPIDLNFNQNTFLNLIDHEELVDGSYHKFIKTIMTLTSPFTIKGFSHQKILQKLQLKNNSSSLQLLASLILSDKQSRKWFMQNNYLQKYFKETQQIIKNGGQPKIINQKLKFLSLLCFSQNLKKLINKYQFNLKVFELLMSKQYQKLLSNHQNKELRDTFVDFIARSSLGSQNQKIISSLLKDSIPNIISQGNQKFVGQIFLPLLNSYQKIAISLIPYSSQQNKLITDISNIKGNLENTNKNTYSQPISKFRLPSGLLSQHQKEKVFNLIKNLNIYSAGNFNLALNHGAYALNIVQNLQKKLLKSSQPFLALFKTKQVSNLQQIIGVFYNRNSKPQNLVDFGWKKGSFIFIFETSKEPTIIDKAYKDDKQTLIHVKRSDQFNNLDQSVQESYIEFKYKNQTFGRISFTYANSSFFVPSILSQKDKKYNMNQVSLQSAQYWLLDTTVLKSLEPQKIAQSLTEDIIKNTSSQNFFREMLLSSKSIQTLKYENVYEFPSSINVSQLKNSIQIMKCPLIQSKIKQLHLKVLQDKKSANLQETATLQTLKKIAIEKDEPVIDLTIQFDNVISLLNFSRGNKTQIIQFLPRKGILKFFQENDGIQAMIKVIKKSIQSWSNKSRMQKWLQYITQLQKFSLFPHFFAMYLKDKQTFTLLFNLLAGLPDKQTDSKWDTLESNSSQKLLKIVSQILHVDKSSNFRQYAMKNDFFSTILERLRILTGQFKRQFQKQVEQQEQVNNSPSKNDVDDDGIKKVKKKKGVGYGNDSSSNTKWMKGQHLDNEKKQFALIEIILNIIQNFLDIKHWRIPDTLLQNVYESALLPYIEDGLRAGTLLEISKHPPKFKAIFKLIRVFSKHERLVPTLLPLQKNYQPKQIQSLESLMKSLSSTASIFISCLQQNKNPQTKQQQVSQQLAKDIIQTYKIVEESVEDYRQTHNQEDNQKQMEGILELPLDKKYKLLMKNLRFDYIDMKQNNKIKHHYNSSFTPNYTPNQTKMIRLAQELADISTALPYQHTNGVYVRCDKDRVDFMQAMIMGSNGTPYGHGAFLFDVYFDDNYPNGPPKVNLTTTGHGKVRFNPNLYACGKVCLSLLGTWRGSASQNWDAKVSTLLQVLLSIQAIIMSEQVYFNEPGFQNQQGTQQGQKKNQAYSNIVRYSNIKFAMIDNMRNPPKGFQTVIRRHFYLKQHQILQECQKWLKYAEKRNANYIGLVNDHNHSWSTQFKKTKTTYKQMLQKAIEQLKQQFAKLPVPKLSDISSVKTTKKVKKQKILTNKLEELQKETQQQIDVTYQKKTLENQNKNLGIDINDQKVKDRWSRYIGAMGIDAVSKQSKADILVFGLNPFALQVIKNLVLSGCRKLTICDQSDIKIQDLSGGFFYSEQDVGKKKQSILYKIKELNAYVKIQTVKYDLINSAFIKPYSIVLATQICLQEQIRISKYCRQNKVKFISADCYGFTCRIINDLGDQFEVLDKNGEEPVEIFIKEITSGEKGVVTLLDGVKNPFEDGQAILIRNVQGMKLKQDTKKSINDTIHKVKVINSKSFQIGNTLVYEPYIRNGTAKNIKTPVNIKYQSFQTIANNQQKIYADQNLQFFDFAKLQNSKIVKSAYLTLNQFKNKQKRNIQPWNATDLNKFVQIFKQIFKGELNIKIQSFIRKFALTCSGNLPPLCAFFGGMVCQQIIKSITQKFKPIGSQFYLQFSQILPQLPQQIQKWNQQTFDKIYSKKQTRDKGFQIVVGHQLIKIIQNSKLFMIGAGAIGCELLKNFAMISFGTGESGKITLTDPDHIQNSNLNRQFLFREKHISKSKSRTAAASILLMNPYLKNHISPLTQRISDSTKDIFTNKFFSSLTLVTNALDNVAARRYVDQRCVQNKVPLFESGTLGPKGHVQVIIPYLTESYGSQNDPVQQGEIPHCTLKMFPEQTLHCIEWARDIFGKKFSLQPKALIKTLDKGYKPQKDDIKSLNQCLTMVKKGPKTFDDCILYAVTKFYKYYRDDIMQLLYTYPLDAKTKNGQPFWKLPKRPPTPLKCFDPQNLIHCTFVSTLAVLVAKIYEIQYPKSFRTDKQKYAIGKEAAKKKIPQFVPSDQKAKQILKQSSTEKKQGQEQQQPEQNIQQKDQNQLYKEIISTGTQTFKIKSEEFEKDDDSNGHIDFIYAMANLRAINYKLDQMDWINVKLKAGRIVPALATTTSCVAGLQTLQLCKYLKKTKIDLMRNSYINLAVPSIQMSEPGQVIKKKLTQKITVNLWDRWQVECNDKSTFGQLYKKLQEKYEIRPIGVLQGMSRIDTGKNQQQKQAFLKEVIVDKLQKEDDCIDVIVLFTKLQEQQKILEGVPPVRLIFKK